MEKEVQRPVIETEVKKNRKRNQYMEVWSRLKRNKMAVLGLAIIVMLLLVAIFADVIADYDTLVVKQNIVERLQPPSKDHIFGTDEFGRDIFARIVHGSRISIQVGSISVAMSLVVGGLLGAVAGYYGGKTDNIIMRLMDILLAVPSILLAITIVAAFGTNLMNLIMALGIAGIPKYARIVRAAVLGVKDQEFIEAARAIGATDVTIILREVIPNCLSPIIVQVTLSVAGVILSIASLSFIGLGIQPPAPEWGAMLSGGRQYLRDAWHITVFPGLAIMITILALNLLGDGLRDALDPRLKQ